MTAVRDEVRAMAHYFPLFVDLSDKTILVVGGGSIALRRAKAIRPFAGTVTVVARHLSGEFAAWAQESAAQAQENAAGADPSAADRGTTPGPRGSLRMMEREFRPEDLEGVDLVLACTDDHELNHRITAECRRRGIPANNAADKTDCDFYFPGLVDRDPVVVGITASGQAHHLAKEMREKIETVVDETLSGMKAGGV